MLESSSLTGTLYAQAQKAIDEPFSLAPALIAIIFLLISTSAIQSYNNRQRIAPGIPIVGADGPGGVKAARKRFLGDAKGMLREGYEQVGEPPNRFGKVLIAGTIGQRWTILRTKSTWRTFDVAPQIY